MAKLSVIERAEQRQQEEIRQNDLGADNVHLLAYWSAYLDGARAQLKECKSRLIDEYYKACLDGKVRSHDEA